MHITSFWLNDMFEDYLHIIWTYIAATQLSDQSERLYDEYSLVVVFRSNEKIGYGIVWELQNDDRSLDAHDRLLLTSIKIFIYQKWC